MLCWCKSRVTQGVVSFPTDLMQVGWQVMVNLADGDWFLCYSGYFLLQVMVVGLEKKCLALPRGGEMCPGVISRLVAGYQYTVRLKS